MKKYLSIFEQAIWNNVEDVIPFDQGWVTGGSEYELNFEDLIHQIVLPNGKTAKCRDPHGRGIVFIGTLAGTFVFYEPYVDNGVVKYHHRHPFSIILTMIKRDIEQNLTYEEVRCIFGYGSTPSFASRVEVLYRKVLINTFLNGVNLENETIETLLFHTAEEEFFEKIKASRLTS